MESCVVGVSFHKVSLQLAIKTYKTRQYNRNIYNSLLLLFFARLQMDGNKR